MTANDLFDYHRRNRCRIAIVVGGEDDMCAHRHQLVLHRDERYEVMTFEFGARSGDDRQFMMRIGHASAVARHMLHDRQHATRLQPFGCCLAH
ncbi:hypothetical protein D3C73_1180450 [compost metagenome]